MRRDIGFNEWLIRVLFQVGAWALTVALLGGGLILIKESLPFWSDASIGEFFPGLEWAPLTHGRFGVLPLVWGTVFVAAGALVISGPIGVAAALYLSEYASERMAWGLEAALEFFFCVPAVVYGYVALTFVTPRVLAPLFPDAAPMNAASAMIVLGIMMIPTVSLLSHRALKKVSLPLKEAAYAAAATPDEVNRSIVLRSARSGIFRAWWMALARVLGETAVVTLAAGSTPELTLNPLTSIQTMTGFIGQAAREELSPDAAPYRAVAAAAFGLGMITIGANLAVRKMSRRLRESAK